MAMQEMEHSRVPTQIASRQKNKAAEFDGEAARAPPELSAEAVASAFPISAGDSSAIARAVEWAFKMVYSAHLQSFAYSAYLHYVIYDIFVLGIRASSARKAEGGPYWSSWRGS